MSQAVFEVVSKFSKKITLTARWFDPKLMCVVTKFQSSNPNLHTLIIRTYTASCHTHTYERGRLHVVLARLSPWLYYFLPVYIP